MSAGASQQAHHNGFRLIVRAMALSEFIRLNVRHHPFVEIVSYPPGAAFQGFLWRDHPPHVYDFHSDGQSQLPGVFPHIFGVGVRLLASKPMIQVGYMESASQFPAHGMEKIKKSHRIRTTRHSHNDLLTRTDHTVLLYGARHFCPQ